MVIMPNERFPKSYHFYTANMIEILRGFPRSLSMPSQYEYITSRHVCGFKQIVVSKIGKDVLQTFHILRNFSHIIGF
jgi:hypothetical protein